MKDGARSLGSRWLFFVLLASAACAQVGKVTVIVTDYETGEALPGVTVRAGFVSHDGMSAGPENKFDCVTNSEGRCAIWGHGNGRQATVAVMNSGRYYGATETIRFKGSLSPVATPWNPVVELRLKAIRNPIPMYAKNLTKKNLPDEVVPRGKERKKGWLEMPADSGTVAFDLQKGDWVAPYGEGVVSDFVFNIIREPRVNYISEEYGGEYMASGTTIEITVSNDGDGFIPFPVAERDRHRSLRLLHEAHLEGYVPVVKKYKIHAPNERIRSNIEEDMNYFYRVRTYRDESTPSPKPVWKNCEVESTLKGWKIKSFSSGASN